MKLLFKKITGFETVFFGAPGTLSSDMSGTL
jgi:hypothetical protein